MTDVLRVRGLMIYALCAHALVSAVFQGHLGCYLLQNALEYDAFGCLSVLFAQFTRAVLRCPFGCDIIFVTEAAVRRHRVRMHKYRHAPRDKPEEKFDGVSLTEDIDHIVRRANSSSKEFVVQTVKNTFEWRSLPLDLPIVKNFLERQESANDGLMMPESLPQVHIATWIAGGEIIADGAPVQMDQSE